MRHVKCSGSVKAVYLDKERILRSLKDISEKLRDSLPYVVELSLFGSLAIGEEHGLSDVDLLVIVENIDKKNFWDIYGQVFDIVSENLPVDFDLVVMSEADFMANPNRFGLTLRI